MMLYETLQWKDHPCYYFVIHHTEIEYVLTMGESLACYGRGTGNVEEHNHCIKEGLLHRGHAKNEINTELHNRG